VGSSSPLLKEGARAFGRPCGAHTPITLRQ
jgi:hypothetical protein